MSARTAAPVAARSHAGNTGRRVKSVRRVAAHLDHTHLSDLSWALIVGTGTVASGVIGLAVAGLAFVQ